MNAEQFTPDPNAYSWLSPESVLFQLTEAIDFLHEALPDAALDHVTQPSKDNDATAANANRFQTAVAFIENVFDLWIPLLFDVHPDTEREPFDVQWERLNALVAMYQPNFSASQQEQHP